MTFKSSALRTAFCFFLLFQVSGMTLPGFLSKAHALYWEDDYDGNDPAERKRRPDHFSLFDFMGDVDKDAKTGHYRDLESQDNGPAVNSDARLLEIVSSGVIGLGLGLAVADKVTANSNDLSTNLFVGGALGFGFGVAFGAVILPRSYDVDPIAQTDFLKDRQAWNQDPLRLQIAKCFHSQASFSLCF